MNENNIFLQALSAIDDLRVGLRADDPMLRDVEQIEIGLLDRLKNQISVGKFVRQAEPQQSVLGNYDITPRHEHKVDLTATPPIEGKASVQARDITINETPAGDVCYFDKLIRDEDGAYYVEADMLRSESGNYRLVINGDLAQGFITTDKFRIAKMMEEFRTYIFPLKRPAADPTNNVENVDSGLFVLKANKWYMKKKIAIKYT